MNNTKTQKLLPIEDFGGRIFTTINTTPVQAQKNKNISLSRLGENTTSGVRFLLGFGMYLILTQCGQVYLFLALDLLEFPSLLPLDPPDNKVLQMV